MTEPITGAYNMTSLMAGGPGEEPGDASGPDRFVFFATLLLGVAFLSSVFMTDESALDEREAKVERIERLLDESKGKADRFEPYRQSERDAASLLASFTITRTGSWRHRIERAATDDDPPATPAKPRVELAEGGLAVVTWDEAEGIDVHVYRSRREGEALLRVTDRPVIGSQWRDELVELDGQYAYAIQAVRGTKESALSPVSELTFQLPFEWEVVSVAPDGREWVEIKVTPRIPRIDASRANVRAGDELTGTGLRIVSIVRATETKREVRSVPVFGPDGSRARSAGGKPLSRTMKLSVDIPITRVTAEPRAGGDRISRRFVRR